MFPHYRGPVLRALKASQRYDFDFFGSHEPVHGIAAFTGDDQVEVHRIGFHPSRKGGVMSRLWGPVFSRRYDILILIGNPHYQQTWVAAVLGRLTGKRVLFWAHGWLRVETRPKAWLRNLYYGLANGVLVYGDRARDLAQASGFPADKVTPIYNSLDWDASTLNYDRLQGIDRKALRTSLGLKPDSTVLICTARLTPLCRFNLLLEAAAAMGRQGRSVQVLLVGEGPERANLERQAADLGVDAHFTGAIYDEEALSRLFHAADLTVSPGKVGLTAMHSLSYGVPVVTHGELDDQMPEVEAITQGQTGAFFKPDDVSDLVRAIQEVLSWPAPKDQVRADCRAAIEARYTPARQVALIEGALDAVLPRRA